MNYKIFIDNKSMGRAASLLLDRWNNGANFKNITLRASKVERADLAWKLESNKDNAYVISYTTKAYFFKALATLNAILDTERPDDHIVFPCEQTIGIQHLGVSLDCSRNAVFTVETIKTLMMDMACCGMDELYLYLEDLYPIEGYPYFGYMRGRYSHEEIQEICIFGNLFGIETIPSIQTLAHLATTLHWEYAKDLRDTPDILLVESEEVHQFVEAMIRSISHLFGGTKIHVGMDEAEGLGLGKRLEKHGYEANASLMARHLDMVVKLCRAYGMEPIVWSDMFLKAASPTGSYYADGEDRENPFKQAIPDDVTLVYWDYYHLEQKDYAEQIARHKQLTSSVAFAGGAWTWGGIAPNYSLAMKSTEAALAACKEMGVQRAFCTLWFDNGAETPLSTALPMITYFANCAFAPLQGLSPSQWFGSVFGLAWDSFLLLDKFDHLPGGEEHNKSADNPSKWFFYQDLMLGLFDLYATKLEVG
ncbi:MAG: beta-N-acetylhexosaminidase, partial [Spirochaetia bacterium]|nr:beta-N-acetylhexosaminidase [Spirochaetia bacterium]